MGKRGIQLGPENERLMQKKVESSFDESSSAATMLVWKQIVSSSGHGFLEARRNAGSLNFVAALLFYISSRWLMLSSHAQRRRSRSGRAPIH
jgi:hypothetical protein